MNLKIEELIKLFNTDKHFFINGSHLRAIVLSKKQRELFSDNHLLALTSV